jgi:hypothetical protein
MISTIILLPGITVQAFLTLSGLKSVENFFIITVLLLVSQYFIVRFFHGVASADMAERFSESRIMALRSAENDQEPAEPRGEDQKSVDKLSAIDRRNAAGALLESRIYRLDSQTLWGSFPVYLVNLDLSVIFDEQVMSAITGYLKEAGTAEMRIEK